MRSRIEPLKKIARSLRQHRELILNYFRAQKLLSSGVVEGLNNKAKVTMRNPTGSGPSAASNSPCTTHLASCPSPSPPTNFSDEPKKKSRSGRNNQRADVQLAMGELIDLGWQVNPNKGNNRLANGGRETMTACPFGRACKRLGLGPGAKPGL